MKKNFLLFLIASLLLSFCLPVLSANAGLVPCGHTPDDACTLCDFFSMLQNIYNFLVKIAAPLLGGLFIVIGGLMYILSSTETIGTGASAKKVSQGKKIITSVVIGLIIIYASWLFLNLFFNIFLKDTLEEFLPGYTKDTWYQFHCE